MSVDSNSSGRARNIATGIRSLTIQNLLNSVLALIFLAVALRELSQQEFGVYTAAVLCATIVSTVASFGLQSAAARFVAMLQDRDQAKSWAAARAILVLSLVFGLATALVLAGLSPLLSLYFTRSTSSTLAFVVAASYAFTGTLSPSFQGLVQGLKKYGLLARILLVSRTAMVVFMIAGIYNTHSLFVPILSWTVYNTIIIFWSLKLTAKGLFISNKNREYTNVIRYIAPLEIAGAVNVTSTYSDRIVVGGFLGSTKLGIYNAAVYASNVLSVVLLSPLNTAFLPEVSSSSSRSPGEITTGVRLAMRFAGLTILPASFAVAAMSEQLLKLFAGSNLYLAGTLSLQILAGLFIFTALQGILSSLLQAVGKTTPVMIIGVAMVATDIGMALALVPIIGITGAALSDAFVGVVGFFVALWYTRQYFTNVRDDSLYYTKVVAGSFAVLLVVLALSRFVSSRPLTLLPYPIIAFLVYLGCLKLLRVLEQEDKQYLSHIIPHRLRAIVEFL